MVRDLDYYLGLDYSIRVRCLTKDEGEGWYVEIPLLPGCVAEGETVDDAMENIVAAKKKWIESNIKLGRFIPEPLTKDFSGQLRVRMPKSLHSELAQMAKKENVSLNQFAVYLLARAIEKKEWK
jgi:antitoxin HicB